MRPWQRNVVGVIRRDGKGKGVVHRETFVIKSGPGGLEKRLRSRVLGNEATGFAVTHSLPRYIAS